jgi:hypothetical protein
MKIVYCSYSNDKYRHLQKIQVNLAHAAGFDGIFTFDREWLETTDFYEQNRKILDVVRSAGNCAWKPYIILEVMKSLEFGEYVSYFDCGDYFEPGVKDEFIRQLQDKDVILFNSPHSHTEFTKMDCFFYMDCMGDEYFNRNQLEAGVLVFKKTEQNIKFLEEWLMWCCDDRVNTNDPNISGLQDFPNFRIHQLDQAILTNLKVKYNFPEINFIPQIRYSYYQDEVGDFKPGWRAEDHA